MTPARITRIPRRPRPHQETYVDATRRTYGGYSGWRMEVALRDGYARAPSLGRRDGRGGGGDVAEGDVAKGGSVRHSAARRPARGGMPVAVGRWGRSALASAIVAGS